MKNPVSVSELLSRSVQIQSHEAVAIVLDLMAHLRTVDAPDQASDVAPLSLETVWLAADSTVRCDGCAGMPGVSELARFLETTLAASGSRVPGALRYTIARALLEVDAPPFESVAQFATALERFEKGRRDEVLAAVYARTTASRPEVPSVAAGAPGPSTPAAPSTLPRPAERRRNMPSAAELRRQLREADRELYEKLIAGETRAPISAPAPHVPQTPMARPAPIASAAPSALAASAPDPAAQPAPWTATAAPGGPIAPATPAAPATPIASPAPTASRATPASVIPIASATPALSPRPKTPAPAIAMEPVATPSRPSSRARVPRRAALASVLALAASFFAGYALYLPLRDRVQVPQTAQEPGEPVGVGNAAPPAAEPAADQPPASSPGPENASSPDLYPGDGAGQDLDLDQPQQANQDLNQPGTPEGNDGLGGPRGPGGIDTRVEAAASSSLEYAPAVLADADVDLVLTRGVPGPAFSPSFTADGAALLFHTGRSVDARSALMSEQTTAGRSAVARILDDGARNYHVQPSPDGTRIAFDSDRDGERGVYVADRNGANIHRVSGPGHAAIPSWAPDGQRLTFVRAEEGNPRVWNLWLLSMPTGELRRLTRFAYGQTWSASWFRDGRRIAYSHEDRLMVLDVDSGRSIEYRTPVPGRLVRTPAVSPDGSHAIFQVSQSGAWLLDFQTASARRVLGDRSAEEFAWSPDGRRVAFHSRRAGDWGIWIMDLS